jgi:hypothetical protein
MRSYSRVLLSLAVIALLSTGSAFGQAELLQRDSSIITFSGGMTLSTIQGHAVFGMSTGILGRVSLGVGHSGGGHDAVTSGYLEGLLLKSRGKFRFALGPFINGGNISSGGGYFSAGGSIYLIGSINHVVSLEFGAGGGVLGGSSGDQGGTIGLFSEGLNLRVSKRVLFTIGFSQSSISDIKTQYALESGIGIVLGHH